MSSTSTSQVQMAVFITHNADYAEHLNLSTPIIATQPLHPTNSSLWRPLPLSEFLGIPLEVMKLDALDQNGPSYFNETLALLSIDPNGPSINFCKPSIQADFSCFVRRADGKDLSPHEVQAMVEYIKKEMSALVAFARDAIDGGEETEEDDEEGFMDVDEDGFWTFMAEPHGGNRKTLKSGFKMGGTKARAREFAKYLLEVEEEYEMA